MSYRYRLYLSVVDPTDSGHRTVNAAVGGEEEWSYELPLAARDRLSEPCMHPGCDKSHDILYTIRRTSKGTFGHFPIFEINGGKVIVDVSLPTGVIKLPRDAKRVPPERAAAIWHGESELHEFGASDPAPAREW
jgi:hypothetical protein